MLKKCKLCGNEFEPNHGKQIYCCRKCSDKAKHERYKIEKLKYKKVCPNCGLEFETINEKQIYCSKKCTALITENKIVIKKCLSCDKEFEGKRNSLYCSTKCEYDYIKIIGKYAHVCIKCNKEFKSNDKETKYCSKQCMTKYNSVCTKCGKEFTGQKDRANKFCSRKCFYEYLGYENKNIPKFKSVVSDIQHIRKAKKLHVEYEHIDPLEIFEKDNWICAVCGKKIDKYSYYPNPMSASLDHIIPFSKGGTHTRGNVRATHLRCNIVRGNKLIVTENGQLKF